MEQRAPKMSDGPKLVIRLEHGGFAAGAMLEMTNLRPIGAQWLLPHWEKRCD